MDRAGDAGDDEHHQQAQRVEPQAEVHLQVADRQPGDGRFTRRAPAVSPRDESQTLRTKPATTAADGKARAELAVMLREQRDDRRRQQRAGTGSIQGMTVRVFIG